MDEFDRDREESTKIAKLLGVIICILLLLGGVATYIFISHETRSFKIDKNNVNDLINQTKDVIANQEIEIEKLNEEIEKNSQVNDLIEQLKKEYVELTSKLENKIILEETDAKIAYLTFDDGPYLKTNNFLDVLEENNVYATFFCLEKSTNTGFDEEDEEALSEIYERIINSPHTLANHTADHNLKKNNNGIYNSVDNFMDSILENRKFIEDKYGYTTTIARFPGGSETAGELKAEITKRLFAEGYGYVDWNSASGDGETNVSIEQSIKNVLDTTNNRDILVVLMHDYSDNTLASLPQIIDGLKKQGYTMLPLFYESTMIIKK